MTAGRSSPSHLHPILLLHLTAAAAGCRAPEPLPPYEAPPVSAAARYFTGGILLDASLTEGAAPPSLDFSPLTIRFISVEESPGDGEIDVPLGSKARLLADYVEESPLRPIPRITAGSRVAFGEDAARLRDAIASGELGRSAQAARLEGGLVSGVTTVLELAGKTARTEEGRRTEPRVEVHLHRTTPPPAGGESGDAASAQVMVALVVQGPVRPPRSASRSPIDEEPSGDAIAREFVLLDPLAGGEASFLVRMPSPFAGELPESLAVAVEILPPRRQDLITLMKEDPAFARTLAELAMHGTSPAPASPRAGPAPLPGLASALEALGSPFSQRLGLLLLARETGARLAEDLALAADEKLVASLAGSVRLELSGPAPPDRTRTGFVLESRSISALLEAMSKEKLAPGLQTVLLVHAGQAGAQPASLEDALRGSDGLETLRERIIEENLLALEDSSPAARVRAFDWLASRGRVPEGYDPFATARARRAALEKALEPVAASAHEAPGGAPP